MAISHIGLKWLELYIPALISHWIWSTSERTWTWVKHSQQLRQSLQEMIPDDCLRTALSPIETTSCSFLFGAFPRSSQHLFIEKLLDMCKLTREGPSIEKGRAWDLQERRGHIRTLLVHQHSKTHSPDSVYYSKNYMSNNRGIYKQKILYQ